MRLALGAVCAALIIIPFPAERGHAQLRNGFVLPRGTVSLSAGGAYSAADELFTASGRGAVGRLTGSRVPGDAALLRPLETNLGEFLQRTAGGAGTGPTGIAPDALTFGTLDVDVFLSSVRAPVRLGAGVAPRIEVGVGFNLVRGRQLVQRYGLADATVGRNPNASRNGAVLGRMGANGSTLGALPYLPLAGSPLGQELQRRVRAATGDSLTLPTRPAPADSLLDPILAREFGVDSIRSRAGLWRPGDLEIDVRVRLLDDLGGLPYPTDSIGTFRRAALFAALRLPTGTRVDSAGLFPTEQDLGIAGFSAGVAGDLFIGSTTWVTGAIRYVGLQPVDVLRRITPVDQPLSSAAGATSVRWSPADTVELRIAPRYRLAKLIAFGAEYAAAIVGESTFSGGDASGGAAEVLNTGGGVLQRLGVSVMFTSLPAVAARLTRIPMEVSLGYQRTLAGPEGAWAGGGFEISGSILASPRGVGLRR